MRVLLAPVTVSPTKPLTPSHLKGLLWTDVMYRATARLADVTYRYSLTAYHPTEQTVGFWEYLDRTHGDVDYAALGEEEIGSRYVAYRASGRRAGIGELRPYLEAIERGWVHPASARIIEHWTGQYARLGLHDPGLARFQPPGLSLVEVVDRVASLGMCLDLRDSGGPVYLDATRDGVPLRQFVAADGRPNHLACALRDLVPLAPRYDEVVLIHDRDMQPDYALLGRVLSRLGPTVRQVALGRVPVDGRIRSARHGGGHSVGSLLSTVTSSSLPAVRLGLRLYFIATLGPGDRESLRYDLLYRCLCRADRLLAAPFSTAPVDELLARQRKDHGYVDPYRLTSSLLGRRGPARELLTEVFT